MPEKRRPGQSNAEYEGRRPDPNADFLGAQSVDGGWDPTNIGRLVRAAMEWVRARRSRSTS